MQRTIESNMAAFNKLVQDPEWFEKHRGQIIGFNGAEEHIITNTREQLINQAQSENISLSYMADITKKAHEAP